MDTDRRGFVQLAAGALAALVLPGCAAHAVDTVEPIDGALRLSLLRYPQLGRPGGAVRVRPAGTESTIYVLALEPSGVAAVSPICTHQGCTVAVEGRLLVCPCHGSTYDREGRVLRGPATQPLRAFEVTLTETEVVVHAGARR